MNDSITRSKERQKKLNQLHDADSEEGRAQELTSSKVGNVASRVAAFEAAFGSPHIVSERRRYGTKTKPPNKRDTTGPEPVKWPDAVEERPASSLSGALETKEAKQRGENKQTSVAVDSMGFVIQQKYETKELPDPVAPADEFDQFWELNEQLPASDTPAKESPQSESFDGNISTDVEAPPAGVQQASWETFTPVSPQESVRPGAFRIIGAHHGEGDDTTGSYSLTQQPEQSTPHSETLLSAQLVEEESTGMVVAGRPVNACTNKCSRRNVVLLVLAALAVLAGLAAGLVVALTREESKPLDIHVDPTPPPSPTPSPTREFLARNETLTGLSFSFDSMQPMTAESISIWERVSSEYFVESYDTGISVGISNVTSLYIYQNQVPQSQPLRQAQATEELTVFCHQVVTYRDHLSGLTPNEVAALPFQTQRRQAAYVEKLRETGGVAFANLESVSLTQTGVTPLSGVWTQLGQDIMGKSNGDKFGESIALSNDGAVLAVGAPQYNMQETPGYVRAYRLDGTKWTRLGQTLTGENAIDEFGELVFGTASFGASVSLSANGTILAVGAPWGESNGTASVFQLDGTGWIPLGQVILGKDTFRFGHSVSLSLDGRILAVGADNNGGLLGEVRIFLFDGTKWVQLGQTLVDDARPTGSDDSGFGFSVALSAEGTVVASGAPYGTGKVDVFKLDGTNWNKLGQTLVGINAWEYFGDSVSLSADGTTIAVGAHDEADTGYVQVFSLDERTWVKVGQTLNGTNDGDVFGAVSLSEDGNVLVVGAPGHDGNGSNSGRVQVFQFLYGEWVQVANELDGESTDDFFGSHLELSGNGTIVAVGSSQWGKRGNSSGYASVYQLRQ